MVILLCVHERRFFLYAIISIKWKEMVKIMNEYEYYNSIANWLFDDIDYSSENYTNWIFEDEIRKSLKNTLLIIHPTKE